MAQARTVSVNVELSKKLTMDLTSRSTTSRTAPSISPRRIFMSIASLRSFACTSTGASACVQASRSWRGVVKPTRSRRGVFALADAAAVCSVAAAIRSKRPARACSAAASASFTFWARAASSAASASSSCAVASFASTPSATGNSVLATGVEKLYAVTGLASAGADDGATACVK